MSELDPRLRSEELTPGVSGDGPFDQAIAQFAASVVRAKGVDPVTTELVRLRCAHIHDCRLCGSVRDREALAEGFNESLREKITRYETSDLAPQHKAALRLCDAIILTPSLADSALRDELRAYFSQQQIAELMCDVMKWSQQKALVALRLESAPWDQPIELIFDENGEPGFGDTAY